VSDPRQHVHELIDKLPPTQLSAVAALLEAMIHDDDDELSEEDRLAVAASREYFQKGGQGLSLEEVAASLGFTMDQVRGRKGG
jgi:hypothetical protein